MYSTVTHDSGNLSQNPTIKLNDISIFLQFDMFKFNLRNIHLNALNHLIILACTATRRTLLCFNLTHI